MQTDIDPRDLIGHKAVDRNGDKIGTVDEVYLDDATGRPEWAAVRTGIFGRDAFVPLTTSEFAGDELRVPYDKSLVKESPDFGVGQHLSPAQELQLYRYYGLDTPMDSRPHGNGSRAKQPDLDFGTTAAAAATTTTAAAPAKPLTFHSPERSPEHAPARPPAAAATPVTPDSARTAPEADTRTPGTPAAATPPTAAPAPAAPAMEPKQSQPAPMPTPAAATTTATAHSGTPTAAPSSPVEITCREERLEVTTEWHVLGTAKLRKYVTTEQVERRVPVVRERVRVERTPISEAERATLTDKEIAETVQEVTLREERAVARKYLAPVERIRLVVERYTTEEVIREELRREHVEVHDTTNPHTPPSAFTPDTPRPAPARPLA